MKDNLQNLSDDDLYLLLGNELFAKEKSFTKLSAHQIIEKAKVWYVMNAPIIKEKVCSDETIKLTFNEHEKVNIGTGLIDLVAGALSGIAPLTVSYLIYRQGLKSICGIHWNIANE